MKKTFLIIFFINLHLFSASTKEKLSSNSFYLDINLADTVETRYKKLGDFIYQGNYIAVKNCLESGYVCVNVTKGWSPLMHACTAEFNNIVELLLKWEADVNYGCACCKRTPP